MKIFNILLLLNVLLAALPAWAEKNAHDEKRLIELAGQAYIFAYPLLMMDTSQQTMTAKVPLNHFSHMREFPDHTFTDVVSPNADTLYSIVLLDLSRGPMVLSLPEMDQRYYVMQFMDAWTNVFVSLGSRTTGNRPGQFLITGPDWSGQIPSGMTQVQVPTNMVWAIGRTQTNSKVDYPAVHAIQDSYTIKPLTETSAAKEQPAASKLSPLEQVEQMAPADFFARFNQLMVNNPPAPADKGFLAELAVFGIAPGKAFDLNSLPVQVGKALVQGANVTLTQLQNTYNTAFGKTVNGWSIMPDNIGNYGTDYMFRAFVARFGLGANLREDAVYPSIRHDALNQPLNGGQRYVIRFAAGQLPPVKGFWSITLYNDAQRFVENPINRHAIGDRDKLVHDPDGGLTLYVQHSSPSAEKQANWLPAPVGNFNLIMRLYWPEQAILDNTWPIPALQEVK